MAIQGAGRAARGGAARPDRRDRHAFPPRSRQRLAPDQTARGADRWHWPISAGSGRCNTVTQHWTDIADACLAAALATHVAAEARRGKLPGMSEEDARRDGAGMVALAMGKMGAGEFELFLSTST